MNRASSVVGRCLRRSLHHQQAVRCASGRVLVLADHDNGALSASTRNAVSAASQLGGDAIDIVVLGDDAAVSAVAQEASAIGGVSAVLTASSAHQLPESVAPILHSITADGQYSHIVGTTSAVAKTCLPRLSALLDTQQISDVTVIKSSDTFERPIYAGNAIATVQSLDKTKILTVRPTAFDQADDAADGAKADISAIGAEQSKDETSSVWISDDVQKSDRPELAGAGIVISGGRGLKNGDNFELLYSLADTLGAAVGASRAAVDAGFCANEMQVGQTGKVVAPDLYIAVGISGAIQHLAGMKDSKTIVAINKDADAPIFQVADYGLVADLFDVVPELTEKLRA